MLLDLDLLGTFTAIAYAVGVVLKNPVVRLKTSLVFTCIGY